MPTTVYTCPIPDCTWTRTDDGPEPIAEPITETDAEALADAHMGVVLAELGAHYETHGAPEWVMLVHRLKQELTGRQTIVCVGCMGDRWQAEQAAQKAIGLLPAPLPLPPIHAAITTVGGNALCRAHLTFGEATEQPLPGRTPSGLIMPGSS
jgi:hypothetical protein